MSKLSNRPFPELKIGDNATRFHTVTDEDLRLFAKVSGDANPIHLNQSYAETTQFQQRIAHGMFSGALVSAVLASDLPGPGTIYLSQDLQFKRPVFIGDTLETTLSICSLDEQKPIVELDCLVKNQDGRTVVTGKAKVLAPIEHMEVEAELLE